jgi:hypothetical protein
MKKVISIIANSSEGVPDEAVYLCTRELARGIGTGSVNVHYFLVDVRF